jgi:uncharacterized protein (TIGR03435 family)
LGAVFGQTPDAQLTFDVASVKPHPPGPGGAPSGIRGGPGTADPGQISYINVTLTMVLVPAFGVKLNQITGPDWIVGGDRYDIVAKVPPGTTKEQSNIMLQNLLKERFKMTLHHEAKEQAVYEMVVAKNGLKLKDAASADPAAKDVPFRAAARDQDGFPDIPAGHPLISVSGSREVRLAARMKTVAELCRVLEGFVDRPILDKTGLTGTYDFKLGFSRDSAGGAAASLNPQDATSNPASSSDPGLSLFGAVQAQLGLKLESGKASIDHLIIDHIDKAPTGN